MHRCRFLVIDWLWSVMHHFHLPIKITCFFHRYVYILTICIFPIAWYFGISIACIDSPFFFSFICLLLSFWLCIFVLFLWFLWMATVALYTISYIFIGLIFSAIFLLILNITAAVKYDFFKKSLLLVLCWLVRINILLKLKKSVLKIKCDWLFNLTSC